MMKKRSTLSKLRFPSPRATVLALALAGALSSCDLFTYKDPFPPEYYADNWIDAIGFDVFDGAVFPAPAVEATGRWDFEYRYDNWTNNDAYIDFAAAAAPYDTAGAVATSEGETLPAGLPATAPVYRLELVNLIDGGDFESGIGGTWTLTTDATAVLTAASAINGTGSMLLSAQNEKSITYTPDFSIAPVAGFTYHYCVTARSVSPLLIIDPQGIPLSITSQNPLVFTEQYLASGTNAFRIMPPVGGGSFENAYLDDFKLTRDSGMRLRLRLCPGETKYNMLKGAYRFTVWAHLDPTVNATGNPYDLDTFKVTLQMAGSSINLISTTATYQASAATSGWVMLSVNSDAGALIFDETVLDQPVLDIVIEFNNAQSGLVLLAAPELRYGRSY